MASLPVRSPPAWTSLATRLTPHGDTLAARGQLDDAVADASRAGRAYVLDRLRLERRHLCALRKQTLKPGLTCMAHPRA